jgi:hypothetical protein
MLYVMAQPRNTLRYISWIRTPERIGHITPWKRDDVGRNRSKRRSSWEGSTEEFSTIH